MLQIKINVQIVRANPTAGIIAIILQVRRRLSAWGMYQGHFWYRNQIYNQKNDAIVHAL